MFRPLPRLACPRNVPRAQRYRPAGPRRRRSRDRLRDPGRVRPRAVLRGRVAAPATRPAPSDKSPAGLGGQDRDPPRRLWDVAPTLAKARGRADPGRLDLPRRVDARRLPSGRRPLLRLAEAPTKKPPRGAAFKIRTGGDLVSQAVANQVPSAQMGLTALFGMERGVSPSL